MMMNKNRSLFTAAIVLIVLLAACGGTADTPAPVPTTAPVQEEAPAETNTGSARIFVVDPAESQASYIVNEEFLADALSKLGIEAGKKVVVGSTQGVTGEIQLNIDNPELVEAAQFTVDMAGLSTDQDRRDEWLGENAIESILFPQATFTTNSVSGLSDSINEGEEINFQLTGNLTVRDVTNSVTFDVTAVLSGNTIQGTATLPLKMTDFGIDPPDFANTLTVADDFVIEVELTAREG
jgi:polyisoprenoid-binding protein YceI